MSSLVLINKKGGQNQPVINLKDLIDSFPTNNFKIESLSCFKFVLQKEAYMCKIDLKDAYFSVPLHKDSRRSVQFLWVGSSYAFQDLFFDLGQTPRIFKNLLKVPVSILWRFMINVIIYLDYSLILGNCMKKMFIARDSVIFVLIWRNVF